jgi:hypothetical protein
MDATECQPVPPKPKLRWYQYSLRSLFLLTLICAILCSWFATRATNQRDAVQAIRSIGGCEVSYDCDPKGVFEPDLKLIANVLEGKPPPPAPRPTWAERVFGTDFVHSAVSVGVPLARVHEVMPHLKRLPYLQSVYVLQPDDGNEPETQAAVKQIEQEMPCVAVFGLQFDFDINDNLKQLRSATEHRR